MMKWQLHRACLFGLAITLAGLSPAYAQTVAEPIREGRWSQQGQARLIEMFLDHATTELNLTVEERDGLHLVLQETMDRRAELARGQAQVRRQIRDALADPATADQEFRRLAEAILDVRRQEVELLVWQEERLLEVMSPRQTLRFMLIQQQLAQRIEAARKSRNR